MNTQNKLNRLSFYLWLYLLPALVAISQPEHWLGAVIVMGLAPGLWRSFRRALRRGRWDASEGFLFSTTSACMSVIIAGVTCVLSWLALPCLVLVALEQAHRPQRRGRLAY